MLHIDALSGYFICGAGSLVGAGMLRIAEPHDARARAALRICGWGFVVLGLGLLPAGLGAAAAHGAAQASLALGTLAGMVLIGSGLGQLQGRQLTGPSLLLSLVNSRLRHRLRTRAITDELTGTMTRRALRELAPALIEGHLQRRREVAVLMLDLDRFKDINDTYGHHTGDAVLQMAATLLLATPRSNAPTRRCTAPNATGATSANSAYAVAGAA